MATKAHLFPSTIYTYFCIHDCKNNNKNVKYVILWKGDETAMSCAVCGLGRCANHKSLLVASLTSGDVHRCKSQLLRLQPPVTQISELDSYGLYLLFICFILAKIIGKKTKKCISISRKNNSELITNDGYCMKQISCVEISAHSPCNMIPSMPKWKAVNC